MYFRSCTSSAQCGQVCKCPSSSASPPVSMMYGRTSWNLWQFIVFFILSQLASLIPALTAGPPFLVREVYKGAPVHSGPVHFLLAIVPLKAPPLPYLLCFLASRL